MTPTPETTAEAATEQAEMPFAIVQGAPLTALPHDLYIPPDALEVFTGTREISGKPMLEYFAPLQAWLKQQNAGKQCGW